jgi:CBS domain containing-hemolysin-like protein
MSNPAATPLAWDLVIGITVACVVGSGFCSGCETGLMSASPIRLRWRQRRRPDPRVQQLNKLLANREDPVLTCLIGTNLFNVLASAVMTVALTARYGTRGEWLAMLIIAGTILIWGEILPKVLFRDFPERMMIAATPIIRVAMVGFGPLRWLLRGYSALWRRLLPASLGEGEPGLDRRGMSDLLLSSSAPGRQDLAFRQSLEKFLHLAHLKLGQIMHPIDQVVTVTMATTVSECLAMAASSGFSRLPVRSHPGDDLVGWILVRDLLFLHDKSTDQTSIPPTLVQAPLLVDVGLSPYELLEELHGQTQQLAFVVNRRGETLGLVTLEDLLETVVGSIQDEFDPPGLITAVGKGVQP